MYGYDTELRRLLDLLPASGRMLTKLVANPEQRVVINCTLPKPWTSDRLIAINLDLLNQLPVPERDLLVLRAVAWVTGVKWFQPGWYQGVVVLGVVGAVIEAVQSDPVGIVAAGALSAIAGVQLWRNNYSSQRELDADLAAIQVALRRGYTEPDAARHLLNAIAAVAAIERRGLDFMELLRCQNLRAIADLSAVPLPETLR